MGCCVLVNDPEKSRAVTAGLIRAEAADADGGAFGDAGAGGRVEFLDHRE